VRNLVGLVWGGSDFLEGKEIGDLGPVDLGLIWGIGWGDYDSMSDGYQ